MEFLRKNKVAIIVGLITSGIWQLFLGVFQIIPIVGTKAIKSIEELYYITLAGFSTVQVIGAVLGIIMGAFEGMFVGGILGLLVLKHYRKKKAQAAKKKSTIAPLVIVCIAYCIFIGGASFFFDSLLKKYNGFQNDLTRIKPYVSEKQIIKLEADWVNMHNKEDYKQICKSINNEMIIIQGIK